MHALVVVCTLAFIHHCVLTLTISAHQRFLCFVISFSAAISVPHNVRAGRTVPWGVARDRLRGGGGGGAPRTRKRHQQEHRPQRPTESSDPTQHAKGRTGDRPGPRKGATTRRNVTQGGEVLSPHTVGLLKASLFAATPKFSLRSRLCVLAEGLCTCCTVIGLFCVVQVSLCLL